MSIQWVEQVIRTIVLISRWTFNTCTVKGYENIFCSTNISLNIKNTTYEYFVMDM